MDRTREFRRLNEPVEVKKGSPIGKLLVVVLIILCILAVKFIPIDPANETLYSITNTSTDFMAMIKEIKEVVKKHTVKTYFKKPIEGAVTSGFGPREDPITKENSNHTGIDIDAVEGTKVMSAGAGEVFDVNNNEFYGNYIIISHENNIKTLYGHLNSATINKGDKVNEGQEIAISGNTGRSTGPHLHFEVRVDDKVVDPINYLKQ